MAGGEHGSRGANFWYRKLQPKDGDSQDGEEKYSIVNLSGSNQCIMEPGDRIVIHTPGGGGYGRAGEEASVAEGAKRHHGRAAGSLASFHAAQQTN